MKYYIYLRATGEQVGSKLGYWTKEAALTWIYVFGTGIVADYIIDKPHT